MALPVAAVAKIATTVLTNDKLRKAAGWIVAAVLSPLILILVLICSLLSGTADHNNTAVGLCFDGAESLCGSVIAGNVPEDYRGYIEDMRGSFALLDGSIASVNAEMEDGDSLDSTRVKAIFYSLYFGADSPSRFSHRKYVDCFVTYEERTRTVENEDGTTSEETYTVAVPIRELPVVYANIASVMGTSVTHEHQVNAMEIYYRVLYGRPAPTYGDEFDEWSDGLPLSDAPFIGADGFCSPLGESWRSMVTSEFGYRKEPVHRQECRTQRP